MIGFPWTIRVIGFVILFNSILIVALARPRVSTDVKGPLVELAAFREILYAIFAVGIFLIT